MAAEEYFRENAAHWRKIRSLHVPEEAVEEALLDLTGGHKITDFLDIGTGTGRMLELFGPKVTHAIGIDTSREMLSFCPLGNRGCGAEKLPGPPCGYV